MARVCSICEKGPVTGNQVSHSNIKTRTRWMPNLQRMKAVIGGTTRTRLICTRCIRSGKVVRPTIRRWKPEAATKSS